MKKKSIAAARFVWRRSLAPLVYRLPRGWGARIHTLAHYTKMTLLHGHVLHFNEPQPPQLPPAVRPTVHHQDNGAPQVESKPVYLKARARKKKQPSVLPDYAVAELKELERIEADLAPTPEFISRFHTYVTPTALEPARVYAECSASMSKIQPDIVILVPWLVRGGADLGALLHAQAAISAEKKVVLVATLDAESPWKNRIPSGAGFIEYGKLSNKLTEQHRQEVLIRLLLDSSAKTIHVINAQLGWEIIKRYGKSLTGLGKKIYASAFSDGRDENGVMWSYPRFYFVDCWRYLSGVICDSSWYPDDLVRQYGVSREKLYTAYFPLISDQALEYRSQTTGCILWASRITLSKRPDLLIKIARALPDIGFDVFGYTEDAERHYESELKALPNIALRGKYESLSALAAEGSYSAFLYTSAWDGLPNVLLEATAAGLPVIASAICGVPEFINDQTGYPVFAIDNVDAYVAEIRSALADPAQREQKWQRARELLSTQHSPEHFLDSLRAIPGYLD